MSASGGEDYANTRPLQIANSGAIGQTDLFVRSKQGSIEVDGSEAKGSRHLQTEAASMIENILMLPKPRP